MHFKISLSVLKFIFGLAGVFIFLFAIGAFFNGCLFLILLLLDLYFDCGLGTVVLALELLSLPVLLFFLFKSLLSFRICVWQILKSWWSYVSIHL